MIQGILEELDVLYTGSGVKASQMAFNKILTQKALQSTPVYRWQRIIASPTVEI